MKAVHSAHMFQQFGPGFHLLPLFLGVEGKFFHVGADAAFDAAPAFGTSGGEEVGPFFLGESDLTGRASA